MSDTIVFQDCTEGRHTGWATKRIIRHCGGNLYESEVREMTPANPAGRVVGGEPSRFTLVDGVARWTSNGSILMKDVVRDHAIDRTPGFDRERHETAYAADLARFVADYRRNQPAGPSAEERAEMRANFPAGTVLVDVISGRKTTV